MTGRRRERAGMELRRQRAGVAAGRRQPVYALERRLNGAGVRRPLPVALGSLGIQKD